MFADRKRRLKLPRDQRGKTRGSRAQRRATVSLLLSFFSAICIERAGAGREDTSVLFDQESSSQSADDIHDFFRHLLRKDSLEPLWAQVPNIFAMHSCILMYVYTYIHASIYTDMYTDIMQLASIHETCREYKIANQAYLYLCLHKHAHTHTFPRVRARTHTLSLSLCPTHT